MGFLQNLQNASNWNIGFCNITPKALIQRKTLGTIHWLKHPYKDRFFADPFILDVTESETALFAEEYVFDNPPGLIVELVVDNRTKQLKQRYELLRLPTHLSYPAIIRVDGIVYVYPENGASGKLHLYKYDAEGHKLIELCCIIDEAVFDSTIFRMNDGSFLLTATKYPETQEGVYAYWSKDIRGPFKQIGEQPFQNSRSCSRPAGNFFEVDDKIFRPAQNCVIRYGAATTIMEFNTHTFAEQESFVIHPQGYKYSLGLHTVNFYKGVCILDGNGYLYPTLGWVYTSRIVEIIRNSYKSLLGRKKC